MTTSNGRVADQVEGVVEQVNERGIKVAGDWRNYFTHRVKTVFKERFGDILLDTVNGAARLGMQVVARDEGPGIADVQQALRDGFSTSGGLGLGLPGVRRLVDEFQIVSDGTSGTTVTIRKWKP